MNFSAGLLAASDGFTLGYIWDRATAEAKVIIILLLVFSIFAWSVMASKAVQIRRARRLNHYFEAEFRGQPSVLSIYDRRLQVIGCPLFAVYLEGCSDLDAHLKTSEGNRRPYSTLKSLEHVKRTLEGSVAREALRLESGLVLLAVAVSGAPFLGLLGTVWGVMDAFGAVALAAQQGVRPDIGVMAPGVSAALSTTVAGLLVAIPSMFGYNWLVHSLRVAAVELDNFAQSLASRMETEFLKDE